MHKKIMAICLTAAVLCISVPVTNAAIDSEKANTLTTPTSPIDVAVSADGKKTFVLSENGKVYVFDEAGALQGAIPVDASTTKIDVSPAGDKLYAVSTKGRNVTVIDVFSPIDISGSPFKGKADAPVILVEFSDFECPYCSKVGPLLKQILDNNPSTVKIVFKHFPLSFHQTAAPAAMASIAAHNQGKFWEYHDLLFANQHKLSPISKKISTEIRKGRPTKETAETLRKLQAELIAVFEEFAAQLGLNMERFRKDLQSNQTQSRLKKDMQHAKAADVKGTPALYLNGKKIDNQSRSYEAIQAMIDQQLSRSSKKK